MNSSEQALCDAIDAAGKAYSLAIAELAALSPRLSTRSGGERCWERLQQIARQTRDTEQTLATQRAVWERTNATGARPGPALQQALLRQATLLGDLIQQIDGIEQQARSARDELAATMAASSRSEVVHLAYARSVRQASG